MDSDEKSTAVNAASAEISAVGQRWFGALEQPDFEIDFYERIAARPGNNTRVLRLLGELYARAGRFDCALAIDRRLVSILPDDPIVVYNLACSLAMSGAAEPALEELDHALALGYHDFSHLEIDPDLESVRQLPQFSELLKKYSVTANC